MKNIALIGMPGVGKSTVGVVLAKNMGMSFLDSDLVIQEQEGKRLHELIGEHGMDGFLEIEARVNASLNPRAAVIATGGSAVYSGRAMEHLRSIAMVCYLKLPCRSIEERLGDLTERGWCSGRERRCGSSMKRGFRCMKNMPISLWNVKIRTSARSLQSFRKG